MGQDVRTYAISTDLRLPQNGPLLAELLAQTRFFRDILTIRHEVNRESAIEEFTRALRTLTGWDNQAPDDVLRAVLTSLAGDPQALQRIYTSPQPLARLQNTLQLLLTDAAQFELAAEIFR